MAFGHAYPWQVASRMLQVPLTCRLRRRFDPVRLRDDVMRALAAHEASEFGAFAGDFTKTAAFRSSPYIEQLVDELDCEKQRVRIMALAPGADSFWQCDHELDRDVVRVHIPVITNRGVLMQICHEDCRWQPGELWFGDFAFPHRLRNTSRETRIHIVIDLVSNAFVRGLFPRQFEAARADRERARKLCGRLYAVYNAPSRMQSLLHERLAQFKAAPLSGRDSAPHG
jgi:hypothetical protein